MHAAKRVALNTGFLYAKMAITVFISLYSTRLIINALGVHDFGLFSVIGGAITMLTFLNNAMTTATQRYLSFASGEGDILKQKSIFNISIVLHFIAAILVVLLLEVAGYFLFNGILKIQEDRIEVAKLIYHFMLFSTFFAIISVPYDAVINAHENMLLVAILGIIEAVLKLSIAIYITHTYYDKLVSFGLLMALLSIFLLVIRRIYCHYKYEEVIINIKHYFNVPLFKEMTAFAGWSFLASTSSMIANYGQGILLNFFFGTRINAAQGIAAQVSGQLGAFATTLMKALNPVIAKSEGAGNRSLMIEAVMTGSKISFFLLTFFLVPVLIEMPYIFKLWLKNVPNFTIIFCQLLLIRNLIEQLFIAIASSITAHGQIKNYVIISALLCYFPIVLSYILISYGYPSYFLYISFIIYALLAFLVNLYFAQHNFNFPVIRFLKNIILRCFLTFFFIYSISSSPLSFVEESLIRLLLVISLSSITFPVAVWIIGFDTTERQRFKQLLIPIFSNFTMARFSINKQ